MKCLVTGGSGFAGANLVRRLLNDGHEVHLLLRLGFQAWRLEGLLSSCKVSLCDLEDAERVVAVVREIRPDWVFHLAVYGAYPDQQDSFGLMRANVLGSVHLVEACLRSPVGAYVNTGSSSEYGPKDYAPQESEVLAPMTPYSVSKAAATQYCSMASQQKGLPGRTLRLYSVYGPWERPTRLIPTLLQHALARTWPPLASPDSAHDFVYVDDVSEAYVQAASVAGQTPGEVYNIGSGVQTSLRQLVDIAGQVLDVKGEPVWNTLPDRLWDTPVWIANATKAAQVLRWRSRVTLREGLTLTLEQMK